MSQENIYNVLAERITWNSPAKELATNTIEDKSIYEILEMHYEPFHEAMIQLMRDGFIYDYDVNSYELKLYIGDGGFAYN